MLNESAPEALCHARWAKGWSIRKLSAESGISHTTIVKIEKKRHGWQTVSGRIVYALAGALELDARSLFVKTTAGAAS